MADYKLKCRYCLKNDKRFNLFAPCGCPYIHASCLATAVNQRFFFWNLRSCKKLLKYRCGHCQHDIMGYFVKEFQPSLKIVNLSRLHYSLITVLIVTSIALYLLSVMQILRGDPRERFSDATLSKSYSVLIYSILFLIPLAYAFLLILIVYGLVPKTKFTFYHIYWEEAETDEPETIIEIRIEQIDLPIDPEESNFPSIAA